MKKKFISLLIVFSIVFSCMSMIEFNVLAAGTTYSGTCGENLTWTLDSVTGLLNISGTGEMNEYVSETDVPWYSQRIIIKKAVIDDGVTSIGDHAFDGCRSLTSITIPNSVTSIGFDAFFECSSLKYNTYDNAKYLGNSSNPYVVLVKANSTSITSCNIHKDTKFIYNNAFRECSRLTSITIPDSVTSIGYEAFYECSKLTSVNISDISAWCKIYFNNYSANPLSYAHNLYVKDVKVTDLVIPDSVTCIGDWAFYWCTSLTSITIGNGVTSIGDRAFLECSSLTSITIPDSVTSIGDFAFDNCSSLTSITIPYGVTSIGVQAFGVCSSLTSITIPDSVTSIDDYAFGECSSLTSITIGNGVTRIGEYAFYECSSLTSITIPDGVTSIGIFAFDGCSSLTSITIPDSVTSIGGGAFAGCSNLTSVIIPDSVTNIIALTFATCYNLTSVTIPNSVTSIGYGTFSGCSSLTRIIIPDSVTFIDGDEVFAEHNDSLAILGTNGSYAEQYAQEYDITFCGIESISVGKTKSTVIDSEGKHAYFAFTPNKSGCYSFSSNSNDDTYGILLDENLKTVTENDDDGNDMNFQIEYYMEAGTKYYLEAFFYSSDKTGTLDVTVKEVSEITNIEIISLPTKLEYIRGIDNQYDIDYSGLKLKLTCSDGTTSEWEYSYYNWYFDNKWINTNTSDFEKNGIVTLSCDKATASIHFAVKDNPVSSISARYTSSLVENVNMLTKYDDERYEVYHEYYIKPSCIEVTVNYKDGSSLVCSADQLYIKTGYEAQITNDQSLDNVWNIGKHTATVTYLGITDDFEINLVANVPEQLPKSNIKQISDPVDWKEISDKKIGISKDWNVSQNIHFNNGKMLCITDGEERVSFISNIEETDALTYSANGIINKVDHIADGESVWKVDISSISVDNSQCLCLTFRISESEYENERYVICTTLDGVNFTKIEFPYQFEGNPDELWYPTSNAPHIENFQSTYFMYSPGCDAIYTSTDLKNWKKHNEPTEFKGMGYSIFQITEKRVYFMCSDYNGPTPEYSSATGIYFTDDFEHYTPIIEKAYPPNGSNLPKWWYVAQEKVMLDENSFVILETELPSDYVANCASYGDNYYLDAKLMVYNENDGTLSEIYSWKNSFGSIGKYWYNFHFEHNIQMYCDEQGYPILSSFDSEGNVLARYELPYSIETMRGGFTDRNDEIVAEVLPLNDGKKLYVSYDYGANYYEIDLPEDVVKNGARLVTYIGEKVLLISDKIYVCDFEDILSKSDSYIALKNKNIKVEGIGNTVFDKEVSLLVVDKGQDIPEKMKYQFENKNYCLYDISLCKNNVEIQPDGYVEVSIQIPDNMNGSTCKVYHIDKDNNLVDMKATFKDGILTFITNHFSNYLVVDEKDRLVGDIDNDGKVTPADRVILSRFLANWDGVTITDTYAADINKDGKITAIDRIILSRYLAGWDGYEKYFSAN